MPYFQPERVPVKCPACGFEFTMPIFSIIDAKDMPDVVDALILGVLNTGTCPRCGAPVYTEGPLFFHHPDKQVAFVYIPPQANIPPTERQKIIGEMTRAVMSHLPQEHPKGYLLQPREFLSLPNMLDAIMEAMGVDKELLEERRRKGELIDKLLAVMDDPMALSAVVGENRDLLDEEFYGLLRYARDTAAQLGHQQEAEQLEALRQKLLPMTEWGRREKAFEDALAFLRTSPTREQLLERVLDADDLALDALVKVLRPLFDYSFFKLLSQRIKEVKKEDPQEAQRLEALRERLLQLTEEADRDAQQALEKASNLLQELLTAPDVEKAVEEHLPEMDDVFFFLLSSQLKEARQKGLKDLADRLELVWRTVERKVRGDVPPEMDFLERLFYLSYPEETKQFLLKNREMLTPEVLELMKVLAEDLEKRGITEGAQHLRQIRAQAMALLGK